MGARPQAELSLGVVKVVGEGEGQGEAEGRVSEVCYAKLILYFSIFIQFTVIKRDTRKLSENLPKF